MIRTGFNKAKVRFVIEKFAEVRRNSKAEEKIASKSFLLGNSSFKVLVWPCCAKRGLVGGHDLVSISLGYDGAHSVIVDFSATVGALRRDYVSELIKPSDQGRGWLDFMKASEVGNDFIVELDVTLSFEEVLEEQACGPTSAAGKRKSEDEDGGESLGHLKSDLKEELASCEKRIKLEMSQVDHKLKNLSSQPNTEALKRVNTEVLSIKAKLGDIESKLEEEVFNSEERVKSAISKAEEKLEAKIKEVKQSAISGPECPVCFHELRPPLRVVQCESGHKICEPCSQSVWCASQAQPVCPGGCAAKLIGRDHGMEAYLEQIFDARP